MRATSLCGGDRFWVRCRTTSSGVLTGAFPTKLYEPINVLKPITDGLWIVDGPPVRLAFGLGSVPFPTRMVVVRLSDGGLWVWSPTELAPALRGAIEALGPVRHVVSPNRVHYTHVADWQRAFPGAVAWASPGVRRK